MKRVVVQAHPVDLAPRQSEGDTTPSPCRADLQANERDAKTHALLETEARCFLHPSLSTPCLSALRASDGIYVEYLQGRQSMDLQGRNVHQVGLGDPAASEAEEAPLDERSFCTRRHTHRVAVNLARKLAETTPGDQSKMLWRPGGTSAMGTALKLALVAAGRHNTISMWHTFLGASLERISIGGETPFRHGVAPLPPGAGHVRAPCRARPQEGGRRCRRHR
jgi:4-aminobutyrate aminotransferase